MMSAYRGFVKAILIIGAVLLLVGAAAATVGLGLNGFRLGGATGKKYVTSTFETDGGFRDVSIVSGTEDVEFVRSEDGKCRVVFLEREDERHTAAVKDSVLTVEKEPDGRKWYERITLFSIGSPKITVYLPEGGYGALFIDGSTGDITIPADFSFGSVDVSVSTGDVDCRASVSGLMRIGTDTGHIGIGGLTAGALELSVTTGRVEVASVECEGELSLTVTTGRAFLTDVSCKGLVTKGDTGDLTMKNVVAEETMSIERDTGDVKLERCDAAELYIKTDTGDVRGTLLSDKVFTVKSDTGRIDVPKTESGGRCEIMTDTGDISISIE